MTGVRYVVVDLGEDGVDVSLPMWSYNQACTFYADEIMNNTSREPAIFKITASGRRVRVY